MPFRRSTGKNHSCPHNVLILSSFFGCSISFLECGKYVHPIAAKEQGLKIMAMLYLTPVIPLGLVSYMCGTTSMNIYSFTVAKIFSLPLYLIYTFIGASAHSFIKRGASSTKGSSDMDAAADPQQQENFDMSAQAKQLEENQFLIVSGILLSLVMMTLITRHIRKELMKVSSFRKSSRK